MLPKGAAKKVTIYVNEDTRHHTESLWSAIFQFLRHKRVAGATVFRPMAGFGAHHVIHSPNMEATMEHMPIRIEFVETAERVDEILPALYEMVADGLIEVQDTTVIKSAMKGRRTEPSQPHVEIKGAAKMIRIYLGESDRFHGEPLYEAIVKRLSMMDVAGATVYRGILGYGLKRHTHRAGFLHFSHDLPIMISIVEKEERVEELIETIQPMMQDGLIAISDVEVRRLAHPMPGREEPDVARGATR